MNMAADITSDPSSKRPKAPHAVVIGSGFGGLAAAVRLGAKGYRVTVLEKLDAPGGRAYTYKQDGFVFDAGPTIITAPYVFEELWDLCGRSFRDEIDLRPVDPFYTIRFDDGSEFKAYADHDRLRDQIAKLSPGDVDGFDRYLKVSEEIFQAAYADLVDVPFHQLSTLIKAAPDLIRLQGYRSVYSKVSDFFKDERLRIAFSFHPLFIGGDPFKATAYYCLIAHLERLWGVHYAIGGTGALVHGIADLIKGQGNALRYNAEVDEILVEDGRTVGVTLTDGERIDADLVVSNADVGFTYTKLLRNTPRKTWTDAKIAKADYSMSLFVWYFGTNKRFEDIDHHTIVLSPRYKGLLKDIFRNKILAEDFSLYLHRPTANDRSLAPEGCDSFYVLAPVPHLDSGIDWSDLAEPFKARIAERLEQTVAPGLRDAIVSEHILTPQDFQDRLLSTKGAAFGMEPHLFQSAWFRPHTISGDVPGLDLVGAGTHPGAGVPSVISSAKVIDRLVPEASAFTPAR